MIFADKAVKMSRKGVSPQFIKGIITLLLVIYSYERTTTNDDARDTPAVTNTLSRNSFVFIPWKLLVP